MRIDSTLPLNVYIKKILEDSKRGIQRPAYENFSAIPIGFAAVLDDGMMDKLGLRSIGDSMVGQDGEEPKIKMAVIPDGKEPDCLRSPEREKDVFRPIARLTVCYLNILTQKEKAGETFMRTALELYQAVYDHISSFEEETDGIERDVLERAFESLDRIFEGCMTAAFENMSANHAQASPGLGTSAWTEAEELTGRFMQVFRQFRDLSVGLDNSFAEALNSLSKTDSHLALLVLDKTKDGALFGSAEEKE